MLHMTEPPASKQPVLLLHLAGQTAELTDYLPALERHGLRLVDCATPETAREHVQEGCKVGLLVITREAEFAYLERWESAVSDGRICWVALVARELLGKTRMREFIAEHLFNFIALPADPEHLVLTLRHAWGMAFMRTDQGRESADELVHDDFPLVGKSQQMQQLRSQVAKIARTDAPILICGPSGSGKELAALAIHRQSARAQAPFSAFNCGAVAASRLAAELFGPGGRVAAAEGGTLFLDAVDQLNGDGQAALLRVLVEGGADAAGDGVRPCNVRVIAAAQANLGEAVLQGKFREDLYYRLNVMCLVVPALAERGHDIEAIARHYFSRFARTHNRSLRGFSKAAMTAMLTHDWPGNVRELVNRVQRATVMAEGRFIQPEDLGLERPQSGVQLLSLEDARAAAERATIRRALAQSRNQISRAAALLGVSRVTLYRLIDKYNIRQDTAALGKTAFLAARQIDQDVRSQG